MNSTYKLKTVLLEAIKFIGILILVAFCFYTLITVSVFQFTGAIESYTLANLLPLFATVIFFLILSLMYIRKLSSQIKIWGVKKGFLAKDFLIYFGLSAGVLLLATIIITLSNNGELKYAGISLKDFLPGVTFFIFIAFVEEFTFRMFIFSYFKKRMKPIAAIFLTSVLFGFYHLNTPEITALAIFNLFLIGVLFNFAYATTNSIYIPVMMHFVWNLLQGPILGFDVSGLELQDIFNFSFPAENILNGGRYGLEGSIVVTVLLIISCLYAYKQYKLREAKPIV